MLGHHRGTFLDHLLHGLLIDIAAVFVAPFAVIRVRAAVFVASTLARVGKNHPAALAIMLGHIQQMDHGHIERHRDELDHVDARCGFTGFPSAHRLAGDVELCGKVFLGHPALFPELRQYVLQCHCRSFLDECHVRKIILLQLPNPIFHPVSKPWQATSCCLE